MVKSLEAHLSTLLSFCFYPRFSVAIHLNNCFNFQKDEWLLLRSKNFKQQKNL